MDTAVLLDVASGVALAMLGVAAIISVAKIARSAELQDRIVALDLLLAVVIGAVAVYSARTGVEAFVDVLVVGVLITFIGSILAARLLRKENRRGAGR